jgi:hypothetical protein
MAYDRDTKTRMHHTHQTTATNPTTEMEEIDKKETLGMHVIK